MAVTKVAQSIFEDHESAGGQGQEPVREPSASMSDSIWLMLHGLLRRNAIFSWTARGPPGSTKHQYGSSWCIPRATATNDEHDY